MIDPLALYIHWPFCKSKCPYCDFNSHVSAHIDVLRWENAYRKSIGYWGSILPRRTITSIFFGGGTPSLMPPDLVGKILAMVRETWHVLPECEITLEANPTSSENKSFEAFSASGVNRVSVGIQSLRAERLQFLGREHSSAEALQALSYARRHFHRYSFDLIYAQPNQSIENWEEELTEAMMHANGHVSLYQLTIEEKTAFFTKHQRGDFIMPSDDVAAKLYACTGRIMAAHGYKSYEISNYAKPGHESRHNLTYWKYKDYLGIGPGAHSRIQRDSNKYEVYMCKAPDVWLRAVEGHGSGVKTESVITSETAFNECILMGLRLQEGLSVTYLASLSQQLCERLFAHLKNHWLLEDGYLEHRNQFLRIPEKYRIVTNRITRYVCELL
ncbi:MAG: coproporphyrinogen III oxidase [Alphaproteobacteria bacterium]|nr:MAG: coproporphyrinogen III oxidase [Alphaproteobacteria bacterium]